MQAEAAERISNLLWRIMIEIPTAGQHAVESFAEMLMQWTVDEDPGTQAQAKRCILRLIRELEDNGNVTAAMWALRCVCSRREVCRGCEGLHQSGLASSAEGPSLAGLQGDIWVQNLFGHPT